jgi:hypothetical protein
MWVCSDVVSATRGRRAGYGAIGGFAIGIGLSALLALPAGSRASSVAYQSVPLARAAALSARVVKGTVKARSTEKVDGGTFHYVEIAVSAVLKGSPARPGETIRVFDGSEWFQHTHAAAIKAGVVSYADPHYATPLPDAEIRPGAALIAFLRGDPPPAGFPANAAFLIAGGAFERPARAADVARALQQKQ